MATAGIFAAGLFGEARMVQIPDSPKANRHCMPNPVLIGPLRLGPPSLPRKPTVLRSSLGFPTVCASLTRRSMLTGVAGTSACLDRRWPRN